MIQLWVRNLFGFFLFIFGFFLVQCAFLVHIFASVMYFPRICEILICIDLCQKSISMLIFGEKQASDVLGNFSGNYFVFLYQFHMSVWNLECSDPQFERVLVCMHLFHIFVTLPCKWNNLRFVALFHMILLVGSSWKTAT